MSNGPPLRNTRSINAVLGKMCVKVHCIEMCCFHHSSDKENDFPSDGTGGDLSCVTDGINRGSSTQHDNPLNKHPQHITHSLPIDAVFFFFFALVHPAYSPLSGCHGQLGTAAARFLPVTDWSGRHSDRHHHGGVEDARPFSSHLRGPVDDLQRRPQDHL